MFRVDIFYAIYDIADELRIHEYITSRGNLSAVFRSFYRLKPSSYIKIVKTERRTTFTVEIEMKGNGWKATNILGFILSTFFMCS